MSSLPVNSHFRKMIVVVVVVVVVVVEYSFLENNYC